MIELTSVAVGDIFVDYVTKLTEEHRAVLDDIKSSSNMFAPIQVLTGGAGVQFAVAAKQAGFNTSRLIGKLGGAVADDGEIGPDIPGAMVFQHLRTHDVDPLVSISRESETGRILILYLPPDRRLMISDSLANQTFCVEDITDAMNDAVAKADLVHVSGYAFLQHNRRRAVVELMRNAREAQHGWIAVDMVPHDLYQHLDIDQLCGELRGIAHIGLIELPTASRLALGKELPSREREVVNEILERLQATFPSVVLSLDPSEAIVVHQGQRWTHRMDYTPGLSSRGQSAREQANLLHSLLRQNDDQAT